MPTSISTSPSRSSRFSTFAKCAGRSSVRRVPRQPRVSKCGRRRASSSAVATRVSLPRRRAARAVAPPGRRVEALLERRTEAQGGRRAVARQAPRGLLPARTTKRAGALRRVAMRDLSLLDYLLFWGAFWCVAICYGRSCDSEPLSLRLGSRTTIGARTLLFVPLPNRGR
jgi:hypothetical protein